LGRRVGIDKNLFTFTDVIFNLTILCINSNQSFVLTIIFSIDLIPLLQIMEA